MLKKKPEETEKKTSDPKTKAPEGKIKSKK